MDGVFVGEVRAMPFGLVPQGWAPCQGQLLPTAGNTVLFTLLGNAYGGEAPSTFALPNLARLEGKNGELQYCIALQGLFPQRP